MGGGGSIGTAAPAGLGGAPWGAFYPSRGSPQPGCARSHQPPAGRAHGPDHLVTWLSWCTVPQSQSHFWNVPTGPGSCFVSSGLWVGASEPRELGQQVAGQRPGRPFGLHLAAPSPVWGLRVASCPHTLLLSRSLEQVLAWSLTSRGPQRSPLRSLLLLLSAAPPSVLCPS